MLDGLETQGLYHYKGICPHQLCRKFMSYFFQYFFEGQHIACDCVNGMAPNRLPYPFPYSHNMSFALLAYKKSGLKFVQLM